jgi:predicted RNA-binding protein with RPS1 domain
LLRDDCRPEESAAASEERTSGTEGPAKSPETETGEKTGDPSKKAPKKDDKRRCIGRKPVTDFVVGQRYPGKVVYTKQFGAFIDVGCHSDAFCHVSRVRDDYVESINDALSIGQEVRARVVEVDRKAKRITVSLQSDARIEDERASVEARRERKKKNGKGKPSSETTKVVGNTSSSVPPPSPAKQNAAVSPPAPLDESMMTPAELKRARKLARRAARREQQAETGLAA